MSQAIEQSEKPLETHVIDGELAKVIAAYRKALGSSDQPDLYGINIVSKPGTGKTHFMRHIGAVVKNTKWGADLPDAKAAYVNLGMCKSITMCLKEIGLAVGCDVGYGPNPLAALSIADHIYSEQYAAICIDDLDSAMSMMINKDVPMLITFLDMLAGRESHPIMIFTSSAEPLQAAVRKHGLVLSHFPALNKSLTYTNEGPAKAA